MRSQRHARIATVAPILLSTLACNAGWEPPQIRLDDASATVRERVMQALERADTGDPDAAKALADLYYALGYPDAASRCYRRAASPPQAVDARILAGLASLDAGDAETARGHFESVLDIDPAHKTARLEIAILDLEAGESESARRIYESLLEDYPEDPRVSFGLARVALATGDATDAVRWFERTLSLRPHADRIRNSLAEAYRTMGRHDLARQEQARAGTGELMSDEPALIGVGRLRLELTADTVLSLAARGDTSAREVAGFTVAQLGSVPGAHRDLASRAEEVGPSDASRGRFWFSVGALADRQGDPEAAVSAYRRAVEASPSLDLAYLRLARALMKLERMGEAEKALIASASNEVSVIRDLALIARRRGAFDEAAAILSDAVRTAADAGENDQLLLDLAETRQGQGRTSEALAIYGKIADTTTDPLIAATAWSRIGAHQQERGDDREAAKSFERAVEVSPEWLQPRYGLAATLGRLQRYEEAADQYRAILDLQPTEEQAWLGAATASLLSEAGPQVVTQLLERGLAVLPDSTPLQAALARHLAVTGGTDPDAAARALELARSLVDRQPGPANRETLAMALAASGRFEEAAAVQQELLAIAGPADRGRLRANLEKYRDRQPCCR